MNKGDGQVRVTITVDGPAADEDARHLYRWLCDAESLRYDARVGLESRGPDDDGTTMGTVLDVVNVALASGFSAANLAATLAMWRAGRPSAGVATLTVGAVTVTVRDGSPETVNAIVRALTATTGGTAQSPSETPPSRTNSPGTTAGSTPASTTAEGTGAGPASV